MENIYKISSLNPDVVFVGEVDFDDNSHGYIQLEDRETDELIGTIDFVLEYASISRYSKIGIDYLLFDDEKTDRSIYISSLEIIPKFRHKGNASLLMDYFIENIVPLIKSKIDNKIKYVSLTVLPFGEVGMTVSKLMKFYELFGFELLGNSNNLRYMFKFDI